EEEKRANSEFIPELRVAASKALTRKYVREEFRASRLENIAIGARTEELKDAAIRALSIKFEDAERVGSLEEALEKSKDLEKTVKEGKTEERREAASRSLGIYYLAFNLNEIDGYSLEKLEKMVRENKFQGLREAAATALESIYPNHYSADELKELIRNSEHELIKRSGAGGLAIRYYSRISPDISLEELREIASNPEENVWLRESAGIAYGELAKGEVNPGELRELARKGETKEIRKGAGKAWSKALSGSDRTQAKLERMAGAATGFAPKAYRSAIISALTDRILAEDMDNGGK
ncbi:hypothetical protein KGY71_02165, partial [Candidatus Bipolaricaulota bacterium]|nr:hypothetical protein [Candidatus Bipolaricaulota bacterium]